MPSAGRQTILREYAGDFPYRHAKRSGGSVNHVAHHDDVDGTAGKTFCARWSVSTNSISTELRVLNVALNLCSQCCNRMDEQEIETLALMASVASDDVVEPSDIQ